MQRSRVLDMCSPRRAIGTGALALLVAIVAAGCKPGPPDRDRSFVSDLEAFRRVKDEAMAGADSPIPPERRKELLPLGYFPPSIDYRVAAVLDPAGEHPVITMPTSTGQLRQMVRVGRLEFTLKGRQLGLSAFVEAGSRDLARLFVPFTDLTSGTETYPAGRYMDLDRTPTGLYVVDFNRAYFPYCYYNPTYDCPYPPRENRLDVPIHAGERTKTKLETRNEQ
jgi:uncharacterized protein (DUF1684 family)